MSGYIYKLSHGDEVLADRGFLVSEELAAHGVTLRIPSFTRGKKQLSAMEVHKSKCHRKNEELFNTSIYYPSESSTPVG